MVGLAVVGGGTAEVGVTGTNDVMGTVIDGAVGPVGTVGAVVGRVEVGVVSGAAVCVVGAVGRVVAVSVTPEVDVVSLDPVAVTPVLTPAADSGATATPLTSLAHAPTISAVAATTAATSRGAPIRRPDPQTSR